MKKGIYFTLLVLFFLAACQPNPGGQGQAATATQEAPATIKPTVTQIPEPTPSPTPEGIKIKNSVSLSEFPKFTEVPRITMEDFLSGKLLEAERKWLEENPFPENAVPFSGVRSRNARMTQNIDMGPNDPNRKVMFEMKTKEISFDPNVKADYSDNSIKPQKMIGHYLLWDEGLFRELGFTEQVWNENKMFGVSKEYKNASIGIISWAILNPDGSTTIGHTLKSIDASDILDGSLVNKVYLFPLLDIVDYQEFIPHLMIQDQREIMKIWELHPELKPTEELTKEWVETGIMPKELENKLFGVGTVYCEW